MPAIAEYTVVRPVCCNCTDCRNRNVVNKKHNYCKNRKSCKAVSNNSVYFIGRCKLSCRLLFQTVLYKRCNVYITLVGYNRFGIVVKLAFSSGNILLDMRERTVRKLHFLHNLVIAFENLDSVPPLLIFRHRMYCRLFNVSNRMFYHT